MPALPDLGRRIVGVFAHPDDFVVAAGGTMHLCALAGACITSLSATRGGAGSDRPDPGLSLTRELEEIESWAVLGVTDVRFLDFLDGRLHEVPFEVGVQAVMLELKRTNPTAVFTYGPRGLTGHPDHRVISAWTTEAFRRLALPGARLFYAEANADWHHIAAVLEEADAMYIEAPDIVPDHELSLDHRLSPGLFARKLRSILAHRSQYQPLGRKLGGLHRLHTWFARESFREAPSPV